MSKISDRFEVVRELGHWELGFLYRAVDLASQCTVAVRTLLVPAGDAETERVAARFLAFARKASGLNSQNIAAIYGGGMGEGLGYVVGEFVQGVTLADLVKQGKTLPKSELLDICRQVCRALDHAHSNGVCHPNLSPANVLIEWDGTVKVLDFGILRRMRAHDGRVPEGWHYAAPEVWAAKAFDARSNIFSWGTILCELATGHRAFSATEPLGLRRQVTEDEPTVPDALRPILPAALMAVIAKAMAKSPEARFQSGSEMVAALEASLQPHPGTVQPETVASVRAQDSSHPVAAATLVPPAMTPPPLPVGASMNGKPPTLRLRLEGMARQRRQEWMLFAAAAVITLGFVVAGVRTFLENRTHITSVAEAAALEPPPQPLEASSVPIVVTELPSPPPRRQAAPPRVPTLAPRTESTGTLVIDSSPRGARIEIDGTSESHWITPYTAAALTPGPHTIRLSADHYQPESRTVEVKPDLKTFLSVGLRELPGRIAVVSEPAGAAVLLDGLDTGKVTPAELDAPKGSHQVVLMKQGFLKAAVPVQAVPGKRTEVSQRLEATGNLSEMRQVNRFKKFFGGRPDNMGRIQVKTEPKGAAVTVNGAMVAGVTPVEFFLPPGSYEITVSAPDMQPLQRVVKVEKGSKETIGGVLLR
jgi:serine/threonine-protein kinase